ncbi:MAG: YajG family lipoprotein [Candidatus Omnitrophota bacterium]
MGKVVRVILCFVLISCVLTGCAVFNAKPVLNYSMVNPSQSARNITVCVSEVEDVRANKSGLIGEIYNGYGIKTGEIREPDNVIQWVTKAMKEELTNAGYNVTDTDEAQLKIKSEIINISASYGYAFHGTVVLRICCIKGNDRIFEKLYTGSSEKLELLQPSLSKGVANVLERSLQEVMKQLILDMNKVAG